MQWLRFFFSSLNSVFISPSLKLATLVKIQNFKLGEINTKFKLEKKILTIAIYVIA